MKRLPIIVLLAAVVLCMTSCHGHEEDDKPVDVVLIYLSANNNLAADARAEIEEIENSWLPAAKDPTQILLVFLDLGGNPTLTRYTHNDKGIMSSEVVMTYPQGTDSATKEVLAQVLADAYKAYPADTKGLVLWSHGSGYLPVGYYTTPTDPIYYDYDCEEPVSNEPMLDPYADRVKSMCGFKSFGANYTTGTEMDIKDLRSTLEKYHFRFVAFDACLMGGAEVAYELRSVADYILASPTETLVSGFPYDKMMQLFFDKDNTEEAMKSCGRAYYNDYYENFDQGTIGVYKTSELPALAQACNTIFTNHREEILNLNHSQVQKFYRMNRPYFYDMESLVRQVATNDEYAAFLSAMSDAVIYKAATAEFLEIVINEYSGLSTYFPRSEYTNLNAYYKTLSWNNATGLVK